MKVVPHHIDDCIRAQTDPEPFSGVVHIARGDDVMFERAYGLAIRSESIPNRIDTRFQTASGSKIFTGVAICQLVDKGQLGFDSLLRDCVDVEFPNYAPEITIHHLLTHTSGITSYFEEDVDPDYEALWKDLPVYSVQRPGDFVPLFQHKGMKFSPGTRFDYNDGGYILLGLVLESVTGASFQDYVKRNVFEPAGMADSGYFATDQLPGRTAYAYIRKPDGGWRTNFFAVPVVGAPDGGAYTTAPDMTRFWRCLTDGRLLTAETTSLQLQVHASTSCEPPHGHYGYGAWIHLDGGTVRKFFVEGSDPGVAMRSAVYPERDLILTMMGNTADALWPLYRQVEEGLGL
jgi:CubicO group peptidase (beta-lactamase class C family)